MTKSLTVDVVGVGLNATDTLIPLPCYPALGSKVEFHSANVLPGGQVASAMVACQQWGLRTRYVGKVGDDPAAMIHRAEFDRLGVEAHLLTAASPFGRKNFGANGLSIPALFTSMGTTPPRRLWPRIGPGQRVFR